MNENLYTSPEPVEEEFVLDEITRRNAKSLGFAAMVLWLVSIGMTLVLLVLAIYGLDWMWDFLDSVPFAPMILFPIAIIGAVMFVVGMFMSLGCGREVARHGRWVMAASLGCLCVPPAADALVSAYWDWENTILLTGYLLWAVFLWRMSQTLGIRRVCGWLITAAVFWVAVMVWDALYTLGLSPTNAKYHHIYWDTVEPCLFVAGCVACIIAMLILRRGILRGLKNSQNTENENE